MTTARPFEQKLRLQCLFCGGSKCRRCGHTAYRQQEVNGIQGIHSSWVGDSILAMARPSTSQIQKFHVVEEFTRRGIRAIFNMTEPGEHPYCGDGLTSSGFTYQPETFMNAGVMFFNFGWRDMSAPEVTTALNFVKVMAFTLSSGGKIAVHCHAGYGRTGVAIACLLIFHNSMTPRRAIEMVRAARPGTIQTKAQVSFVLAFAEELRTMRTVFATPRKRRFSLATSLARQTEALHGMEVRTRRNCPKIVHIAVMRLMQSAVDDAGLVASSFLCPAWGEAQEAALDTLKRQLNAGQWDAMPQASETLLLAQLLLDWMEHLRKPIVGTVEAQAALHKAAKLDSEARPTGSPPASGSAGGDNSRGVDGGGKPGEPATSAHAGAGAGAAGAAGPAGTAGRQRWNPFPAASRSVMATLDVIVQLARVLAGAPPLLFRATCARLSVAVLHLPHTAAPADGDARAAGAGAVSHDYGSFATGRVYTYPSPLRGDAEPRRIAAGAAGASHSPAPDDVCALVSVMVRHWQDVTDDAGVEVSRGGKALGAGAAGARRLSAPDALASPTHGPRPSPTGDIPPVAGSAIAGGAHHPTFPTESRQAGDHEGDSGSRSARMQAAHGGAPGGRGNAQARAGHTSPVPTGSGGIRGGMGGIGGDSSMRRSQSAVSIASLMRQSGPAVLDAAALPVKDSPSSSPLGHLPPISAGSARSLGMYGQSQQLAPLHAPGSGGMRLSPSPGSVPSGSPTGGDTGVRSTLRSNNGVGGVSGSGGGGGGGGGIASTPQSARARGMQPSSATATAPGASLGVEEEILRLFSSLSVTHQAAVLSQLYDAHAERHAVAGSRGPSLSIVTAASESIDTVTSLVHHEHRVHRTRQQHRERSRGGYRRTARAGAGTNPSGHRGPRASPDGGSDAQDMSPMGTASAASAAGSSDDSVSSSRRVLSSHGGGRVSGDSGSESETDLSGDFGGAVFPMPDGTGPGWRAGGAQSMSPASSVDEVATAPMGLRAASSSPASSGPPEHRRSGDFDGDRDNDLDLTPTAAAALHDSVAQVTRRAARDAVTGGVGRADGLPQSSPPNVAAGLRAGGLGTPVDITRVPHGAHRPSSAHAEVSPRKSGRSRDDRGYAHATPERSLFQRNTLLTAGDEAAAPLSARSLHTSDSSRTANASSGLLHASSARTLHTSSGHTAERTPLSQPRAHREALSPGASSSDGSRGRRDHDGDAVAATAARLSMTMEEASSTMEHLLATVATSPDGAPVVKAAFVEAAPRGDGSGGGSGGDGGGKSLSPGHGSTTAARGAVADASDGEGDPAVPRLTAGQVGGRRAPSGGS